MSAQAAQAAAKPEIAGPSMLKDITVGRVMREKVRACATRDSTIGDAEMRLYACMMRLPIWYLKGFESGTSQPCTCSHDLECENQIRV